MTFGASFGDKARNNKLEYRWEVSAGKILDGQGTSRITVETTGLSDSEIIAVVKIKGFSKSCASRFSGSGFVLKIAESAVLDCFENSARQDESAELEKIRIALENEPDLFGHFYIYTEKNPDSKEVGAQISRILDYLSGKLKIAERRIIFVITGDGSKANRICVRVTKDAETDCKSCAVIKGEDFKPAEIL